jgi:hypothetical protein
MPGTGAAGTKFKLWFEVLNLYALHLKDYKEGMVTTKRSVINEWINEKMKRLMMTVT